jgi:hypothetical protein
MAAKANSKGASKSAPKGTSKAGPGKAQKKGRSLGGRTTTASQPVQSSRYTPPVPKSVRTSSRWLGMVAAISAIFVGLILATRYH